MHDGVVADVGEVVFEIAERHSLPRAPIVPLRGLGSVNHVFTLGTDTDRYVVRVPIDPLRQDEFVVEQWCLEQAAQHRIPTPAFVGRGEVSGTPYIVLTHVDASPVGERGDLAAWETLGRYGRLAHEFDWTNGPDQLFTRFGRDPEVAWREHLLYNAAQLTNADPLIELGVYRDSEQPRLRDVVDDLLQRDLAYGLRHGDLAPRNLLRPANGSPVLLDWGQASVGPVPHGDLLGAFTSHAVQGQPTAAELDTFSGALGEPIAALLDTLEGLMVLEALDRVRWALDKRPDRVTHLVNDARRTLHL